MGGKEMSIPKDTLINWSKQGATVTPKALREKIQKKLTGDSSKIYKKNQLEIYLQGSYRNNTNIFGSSDVDIVVQHDATFFHDISELETFEKSAFEKAFSNSSYTWDDFKNELTETLKIAFGEVKVEVGDKSIKIDDGSYEADVVPCFEYRKYVNFGDEESEREYIPGIKFFTTNERNPIINFPKEHYSKGAEKNQRINQYYKPTVRVFKNMKKRMIDKNMIDQKAVSSYYLENLLYNVPDETFNESSLEKRVFDILVWLGDKRYSLSGFTCQNEQNMLFTDDQWNTTDAKIFIDEVIRFWNEWE